MDLRSPWTSLELLMNPKKSSLEVLRGGAGPEARGPGHLKSTPESCCIIIILVSTAHVYDPGEQYTSDSSLPVHHAPP